MSSPANVAPNVASGAATAAAPAAAPISTPALLAAMLRTAPKISDLFFTPGKPPLIEVSGKLAPTGTRVLTSEDTQRIASDLIGNNQHALANLKELGSCDVSYSLQGAHRFRVNIFRRLLRNRDASDSQRGSGLPCTQPAGGAREDCGAAQRHRAGDGSDRFWKIFDAGGDHRQD